MITAVSYPPLNAKALAARNIQLPVCPAVFLKLTAALGDAKMGTGEIAGIINQDPVLTAQALRVANSAYYGSARNIRSIDQAIFRIGLSEICSIASALKAKQLFQSSGGTWTAFYALQWKHCVKTAVVARALARQINPGTMDIFFTAGLLHDFGKLVLQQVDGEYAAASGQGKLHGHQLVSLESKRYGTHHAYLGAEIMRAWNLPNPIANLVEKHHGAIDWKDPAERSRACFALANEMAHTLTLDGPQAAVSAIPNERAVKAAGLKMETCLAMLPALGKEVQNFLEV